MIKRLQWYYPTEKFHTFITFPGLLLFVLFSYSIEKILFLIYGLLVCIVILYQGQWYWKLKLNRLMGKPINQERHLKSFRQSKKLNFLLIFLMPVVFVLQEYIQGLSFKSNALLVWGLLANAFAILEHVNYYHIQLMIDNKYDLEYVKRNRKLKRASLAKDLRDNEI